MLIGEYSPNIDAKGRMNFPARLREDLGERFMITKGPDNCLWVLPMNEWTSLENKIKEMPVSKGRGLQRFFFTGACEAQPDKQGRVLIPANLREYANLDKDVVVAGVSNRAEIWNRDRWEQICSELSGEAIESAMEELGF